MSNDVIDVPARDVTEKKPGFLGEPKWASHWFAKLWAGALALYCGWIMLQYAAELIGKHLR